MTEEQKCGRKGPGGVVCTLPAGHGGKDHAAEFDLPPDLAQLMEKHLSRAEAAQAAYNKARRHMRWASWALGVAIVVNLVSTVINVLGAAS